MQFPPYHVLQILSEAIHEFTHSLFLPADIINNAVIRWHAAISAADTR
jgi:hypothetical protein